MQLLGSVHLCQLRDFVLLKGYFVRDFFEIYYDYDYVHDSWYLQEPQILDLH